MGSIDNKALYAALLLGVWVTLDFLNIKDPALISTLQGLLLGLGIFHATTYTPPTDLPAPAPKSVVATVIN